MKLTDVHTNSYEKVLAIGFSAAMINLSYQTQEACSQLPVR